jgi:hypothetical protein
MDTPTPDTPDSTDGGLGEPPGQVGTPMPGRG